MAFSSAALAADHQDGTATTADPASDITDVYAWMSADHTKLNLVMNVFPAATTSSQFSDSVQYVFHTSSAAKYGDPAVTSTDIICTFDSSQKISCWAVKTSGTSSAVTTEYVVGNASSTTGLKSADGRVLIFAGLRDDPFFFNLDGFKATAADVHTAAGSGTLVFDAANCPALDGPTSTTLVTQLGTAVGGGPAVNHFAGLNVLSIVLQVDATLLNSGGSIVAVSGSTNKS
jgi:hypothetical protein